MFCILFFDKTTGFYKIPLEEKNKILFFKHKYFLLCFHALPQDFTHSPAPSFFFLGILRIDSLEKTAV